MENTQGCLTSTKYIIMILEHLFFVWTELKIYFAGIMHQNVLKQLESCYIFGWTVSFTIPNGTINDETHRNHRFTQGKGAFHSVASFHFQDREIEQD